VIELSRLPPKVYVNIFLTVKFINVKDMPGLRTYNAVKFGREIPIFQGNMLFPSSFDGIAAQRTITFNSQGFTVDRN
jgi:hypothetical protein